MTRPTTPGTHRLTTRPATAPAAPATLAPGTPGWRRFSGALFAAGYATFALIFAPQAFLPALSTALAVDADTAAATVSVTALGVAAGVLGWAALSDRTGRVRAMRLSLVAAVAVSAAVPLMPNLPLVLVARFVEGLLVGAAPAIGMAYIAERVAGPSAARAAGVFVAGNTVGGIVGRLAAGFAADLGGWRVAFGVATVIAAAAVAVFLILTRRPDAGAAPPGARSTRAGVAAHLRNPSMMTLYLQGFLLMGAFGVIYNFIGYRLQDEPFVLPAGLTSSVFVVYLAGSVAANRSGVFAARVGDTTALLAGTAAMLVSLPLMALGSLPVVITGLVLFTIGCFTAHPLASGLTGRSARTGRSQATALYQIAWLTGTSLFGWVGGVVYTWAGWTTTLSMVAVMCVLSGLGAAVRAKWLIHRGVDAPAVT